MPLLNTNPEKASLILAGRALARDTWNRWVDDGISKAEAVMAVAWLLSEACDRYPLAREAFAAQIAATKSGGAKCSGD